MDTVDVAMVIGANDVVNPSAREDERRPIYGRPIYGRPIIDADKARTCLILKRSMASGFANIDSPAARAGVAPPASAGYSLKKRSSNCTHEVPPQDH